MAYLKDKNMYGKKHLGETLLTDCVIAAINNLLPFVSDHKVNAVQQTIR